MRMKNQKDTTTLFYKRGTRKIDGVSINVVTANGTMKVCMNHYPLIKLNIMYKTIGQNISKMKPNIMKIRKEMLEVLSNNGFAVQKERRKPKVKSDVEKDRFRENQD